jgi:hypothetical protein
MAVGKKVSALVFPPALFLLAIALPISSQTRIGNPARALAKNAGRVVNLEEIWRIRDDGKTAIFKGPHHLARGNDGSLYFMDYGDGEHLFRYGPDGNLLSKLLKTGQGPGEVQHPSGYVLTGDRIRILAWAPPKIMELSLDGRYLGESRVEKDCRGLWFLGMAEGKIYGIRDEMFSSMAFRSSGAFTTITVLNSVYEISPDFRSWKKIYDFPVRMMIKRGAGFRLDPIDAAIGGSTLYIVHTAEYEVIAFDLRADRVKHAISRAYDRVRSRPQKASESEPDPETRGIDFPDEPYVWDIDGIHAAAGKLWVFTSVMRPGDQQVDLFDEAGRYVDNAIFRFPPGGRNHRARWTLLTDDGFFIIPEQEEDGLISIGKYRILDTGLFPAKR